MDVFANNAIYLSVFKHRISCFIVKIKKVVASENLASVNLYEKQSNTIENYEEMVVAEFVEISCDADLESLFAIGDDVVGLSLMSREVTRDGTISISTGQRCNILKSECKIKEMVCKLIIDGESFTHTISSDVLHALYLSTCTTPRLSFSNSSYAPSVSC
jgi:hypothetical protein